MIADTMPIECQQNAEEPPTSCRLGRPLGDCSLRRIGCDSLFDVLTWVYPPPGLIDELRSRPDLDPDVRIWLKRLSKCVAEN